MAIGDCYEATIHGVFDGKRPMNNVFHFVHTDGVANGAQALAEYLETDWIPLIANITSNAGTFNRIRVRNLFNTTDFYDNIFTPVVGTRVSGALPPDCALAYTFPTLNLAINAGGKRFGCIPETAQEDGIFVEANYLLATGTLGAKMIAPIDIIFPLIRQFKYCIVKRVKVLQGNPPVIKYRLPLTVGEFVYYIPSQYDSKLEVGSQDSRRF